MTPTLPPGAAAGTARRHGTRELMAGVPPKPTEVTVWTWEWADEGVWRGSRYGAGYTYDDNPRIVRYTGAAWPSETEAVSALRRLVEGGPGQ